MSIISASELVRETTYGDMKMELYKKKLSSGFMYEINTYMFGELSYCTTLTYEENGNIKQIFNKDRTDKYNEPCVYNKTVRGLQRVEVALLRLDCTITQKYVGELFDRYGIRSHYYCAVD